MKMFYVIVAAVVIAVSWIEFNLLDGVRPSIRIPAIGMFWVLAIFGALVWRYVRHGRRE